MRTMNATESDLFDRICRRVAAGQGITLGQLGGAHALARELVGQPDPAKVMELAEGLDLDEEDLRELGHAG